MKKLVFTILSLCFVFNSLFAEDFPFGEIDWNDMTMKEYSKNTKAHALVLKQYGKTWISSQDNFPVIHEYHVRIKIFDSNGFKEGNVLIPLYTGNRSYDLAEIQEIEGVTIYRDQNGELKKTLLDSKNIITEHLNKNVDLIKFAMPNLSDGCVIEYKYKTQSPYNLVFNDWTFQEKIPKVHSEYEVHIPAFIDFNITLRGPYKLTKQTTELEKDCVRIGDRKYDCTKAVYIMDDIPAFVEEPYMTTSKNFVSKIYFNLHYTISLAQGNKQDLIQDWENIDRTLKQDEDFGGQLRKTSLFKDKLPTIIYGLTSDLNKAQAIYSYFQKNLKHNSYNGIYAMNGFRKTLETHSGSTADINLALVAALNSAGINTEAVLLSTREHGYINKLYPVVSDFDYVIAKANINNKSYLLDASDELLPFGLIPMACINDQGRALSLNKPSYWIDIAASQKRTSTYTVDLTLQNNGKCIGNITRFSNGYDALEKRKSIKKFNNVNEYVEDLDEQMVKIKFLNSDIKNIATLDLPLIESYNIEFDLHKSFNPGLSLNPYIFDRFTENPFKLAERTYPVDWGVPSETRIILTVHLPKGYEIEAPPEKVSVALPNKGGRFITSYDTQEDGFTFSQILQFDKAIYTSEEYPYLKEFFNTIIKSEMSDITFKKKT
jgi:hypothetical protein